MWKYHKKDSRLFHGVRLFAYRLFDMDGTLYLVTWRDTFKASPISDRRKRTEVPP